MKEDAGRTFEQSTQIMGRHLSRRMFLAGAGAAGLGGLSLMLPRGAAGAPSSPGVLPLGDATRFPESWVIWSWQQHLAQLSPPFTGSARHAEYVDFLERELRAARLETQRRRFTFPYWEPHTYGLIGPDGRIPVTGYQPYSGETPLSGVSAPLYYAGVAPDLDYSGAAGKIVVYDAPLPPVPIGSMYTPWGYYRQGAGSEIPATEVNPEWSFMTVPALTAARDAGAVGVVRAWTNISDEGAMHQDQAWHAPPAGVPALWVGRDDGRKLKMMAQGNQIATLKLHATVTPDTPTDNLWAVLPGQTDETIIINSHSDGCNAFEENGGLGVLALAKYFSRIPISRRRRTLVLLITTGHFSHGMVDGTGTWQTENAELVERAVACLTLEHLGGNEWAEDAEGRYGPTGKVAFQPVFTGLQSMAGVLLLSAKEAGAERFEALQPSPGPYFGEGSSFYKAGIATISYIGSTWYTFTAPPMGEISKLDRDRLYGEIVAAALCVEKIDAMTVAQIRGA